MIQITSGTERQVKPQYTSIPYLNVLPLTTQKIKSWQHNFLTACIVKVILDLHNLSVLMALKYSPRSLTHQPPHLPTKLTALTSQLPTFTYHLPICTYCITNHTSHTQIPKLPFQPDFNPMSNFSTFSYDRLLPTIYMCGVATDDATCSIILC